MLTTALDFDLPSGHIAVAPAQPRDSAKLMVIDRSAGQIDHRIVRDLPDLLQPGDLVIFNESKVLPAYFKATRAATGGAVTGLFLEQPKPDVWRIMLESKGSLQTGETISLVDDAHLKLLERMGGGEWLVSLHADVDTFTLLDRIGATPLPPYIRKARRDLQLPEIEDADRQRYNTVYAQHQGSVAAPTAGLHFTPQLLTSLNDAGIDSAFVTLHVGLGTFAPIRTEKIEDHPIHTEWIFIPAATIAAIRSAHQSGGRVIPIGTTTVRSLESLPDELPEGDYAGGTDLFITDGSFPFRFTDSLMTNFHLPKSTLLALVAALPDVGIDRLKQWYGCAIDHDYRFYSYGDAMLIL